MNQEQLRKAISEGSDLEYLFDNDQWLPASITQFVDSSSHRPYVTISLLTHPPEHPGIIHPSSNDIEHRLRLKGSN